MKISLRKVGDIPSYRKVFGCVLTHKTPISNPEVLPEIDRLLGEVKQTKFSKFIQKCLEKLFPEYEVHTKAQFRKLYDFVGKETLDKYI